MVIHSKIKNVFQKESTTTPPIWIMRQAGRYLEEYKKIRKLAGSFLDLCYDPEMASEVTLQPIRRFDFDSAIIFSDILVVPNILGLDVQFQENEGPVVERITEKNDLKKLQLTNDHKNLLKVYEAIALTRSRLDKSKSLIGFAGAPWTVATYILEGRGKHQFVFSKKVAYSDPEFLDELIEIIKNQTIIHLKSQINAGADVIQIFDSWAGVLGEEDFERFVINPTRDIVKEVKAEYPDVPIIGFPRGAGYLYEKYAKETGVNGMSIDQNIPVNIMKNLGKNVVIQGNLDPVILLSDKSVIKKHVDSILNKMKDENGNYKNFIFNLGHGILPETPIENVSFLIDCVRK